MNHTSKLMMVPINDLIPYANNARTHNAEQVNKLRSSLRKYGFVNPVVIDQDKNVIAGHGRLMAARQENIEEIPCVIVDYLTEAEKQAYIIADNRLAEDAGWDEEMLRLEIESLKEQDFDLDALGFDENELAHLLNLNDSEVKEDDFEPDLTHTPISKKGDIFLLGRHRLMCGDSTQIGDVQTLTGGILVDLLITDPPYNVNYHGGDHGGYESHDQGMTIQNDNMSDEDFLQFLQGAFSSANEVMKPGACFYIWFADRQTFNFHKAVKDTGWTVRETLIWLKQQLILGRNDYHYKHEPCLYGWKEGTHLWASDRKQTTIMEFDRPKKNDIHPTMKPIGLFDYQIKNNTKGGDAVLDLFSGSGTTIMACEQDGRNAFAMELDERYVDAAVTRYIQFKGSDEDVFVIRDGVKMSHEEMLKQAGEASEEREPQE